jgi:hypothetical protein
MSIRDLRRLVVAWSLVMVAFATTSVPAQNQCNENQSIQQCWELYSPSATRVPSTAAAAKSNENAALVKAGAGQGESVLKSLETGLNSGAPALATTTRNLLPLLSVTGLISDSDGNANDDLFTVDLNFLISGLADDKNAQLKALLNTSPEVSSAVKDAFGTAEGAVDRLGQFNDNLSAADDYSVSFTYSHVNDRFGRGFKQHQRLFSQVFESAITEAREAGGVEGPDPGVLLGKIVQDLSETAQEITVDTRLTDSALRVATENAARFEAEQRKQLIAVYAANELKRFAELVGNQPQLTLSVDVTKRGDLVFDMFLGSGTSLIAAERTGRQFRGCDIDPAYVDVAVERWVQLTGGTPELERAT